MPHHLAGTLRPRPSARLVSFDLLRLPCITLRRLHRFRPLRFIPVGYTVQTAETGKGIGGRPGYTCVPGASLPGTSKTRRQKMQSARWQSARTLVAVAPRAARTVIAFRFSLIALGGQPGGAQHAPSGRARPDSMAEGGQTKDESQTTPASGLVPTLTLLRRVQSNDPDAVASGILVWSVGHGPTPPASACAPVTRLRPCSPLRATANTPEILSHAAAFAIHEPDPRKYHWLRAEAGMPKRPPLRSSQAAVPGLRPCYPHGCTTDVIS